MAESSSSAVLLVETTSVNIIANDIVYDPLRGTLYASVSGDQGYLGNSIVPIAATGETKIPIRIGSEPNVLALSADYDYLLVGLDGVGAVRRLALDTLIPEPWWPLDPTGECGLHPVKDMVVLTDNANAFAVVREWDCWPPRMGVGIYDLGVLRPSITPPETRHFELELSGDPAILFSLDTDTSNGELYKLSVDDDGVTIDQAARGRFEASGPNFDLRYSGGRLVGSDGRVVDGDTLAPLGRFQTEGPMAPIPDAGKIFFLEADRSGYLVYLKLFDSETLELIASAPVYAYTASGQPVELIQAGSDRLAIRTAHGEVFLVRYQLLDYNSVMPYISRGPWIAPTLEAIRDWDH